MTARRIRRRITLVASTLLIAGLTSFLVWCSILYPATPAAVESVEDDPSIAIVEKPEAVVLQPSSGSDGVGLLFVPGAKVPAEAYASTLSTLADAGVTVVIAKPILNLAFFDPRPLSAFTALAPAVTDWYVGGHSLGGVKACQFAAEPGVSGLVLLGSYCANDLSASDIRVLSVGGSEDGLSTPEKIADAAGELPADADFDEIDGSNHAQFGAYGPQDGDGTATISDAEATARIQQLLVAFIAAG